MKFKKIIAYVCMAILLITMYGNIFVYAAPDDTIYVQKHVSLVYDNSGSMSLPIDGAKNLKWSYASYAAQAFAGLLNDTDTLNLTFMNKTGGIKTMEVDMKSDRQSQISKLLSATNFAEGDTPYQSVTDAKNVLISKGLLSDAQIGDNQMNKSEQFWLVLTTDGVFDKITTQETVANLETLLKTYSNLQIVYFGIGTSGDNSKYAAQDLRNNQTLNAYPNFTAVYAEEQDQIVTTMKELANRISGRYSVSEGVNVKGNTVTLRISSESSPIRNIAVLAQETDAKLLEAKDSGGKALEIARDAKISYPQNPKYNNMPASVKGGYTALITSRDGKVAPGTVTLTFSENVDKNNFSLMYEPAIYVDITIQAQNDENEWVDIPYDQKIDASRPIRVNYTVLEDGTDTPVDADKLGKTSAQISCADRSLGAGENFMAPVGNSTVTATVSLMNGAYTVSAVRNINVISLDAYTYEISDPIVFYPDEIQNNSSQFIDFKVLYEGKAASAEETTEFTVDSGELQGRITTPEPGVFRFTPSHADCPIGEYTVNLCFQGKAVASQTVTVKEEIITYTAKASENLALFSNELASNATPVIFTVTCHKDDYEYPLAQEDSAKFRVEAVSANGEELKGSTIYKTGGELHFIATDKDAALGEYDIKLYFEDTELAKSQISILQYNSTYTAEVFLTGEDKVNRLNLRNNENGLAYIVYSDGEACNAAQLESMLGNVIVFDYTPDSKAVSLNVTVGSHDEKPALIVTPTTSAKTRFGATLQKMSIVYGALGSGEMEINMTVNAPKGTNAVGTLQIYNEALELILWIVIPLVLLALVGLVLWMIACNFMMPRIKPGTFTCYSLNISSSYCRLVDQKSYAHRRKVYLRLWPIPESVDFGGLHFISNGDRFESSNPACELEGHFSDLQNYFYQDSSESTNKLLKQFDNSTSLDRISTADVLDELWDVPIVDDNYEEETDRITVKQQFYSGGFLNKRTERTLDIWTYTLKD